MTDAIVVGAGPAGVGAALALADAGVTEVLLLERRERVGASLRRWPRETRCITPSFQANQWGAVDLNAISPTTSPAFSLDVEHPSGAQWADYLEAVAAHHELTIRTGATVARVHALGEEDGFAVELEGGAVERARRVVWAAGELGSPRLDAFPGAELCQPVAGVRAWSEVRGREHVVVGGFESGIDAAVALIALDGRRRVTVIDPAAPWEDRSGDPSVALSPYTRGRLDAALATGRLELRGGVRVTAAQPLGPEASVVADAAERGRSASGLVGGLARRAGWSGRAASGLVGGLGRRAGWSGRAASGLVGGLGRRAGWSGRAASGLGEAAEPVDGSGGPTTGLVGAARATAGRVLLRCDGGPDVVCTQPPILATGYRPLLGPVEHLVECDDDGYPVLGGDDGSTLAPGLHFAGPALRHDGLIFCFAYKFRGRFPVVASAIARSLGLDEADEGLAHWRTAGLWLDDLSCCGDDCVC